jgi:hypothetical protein
LSKWTEKTTVFVTDWGDCVHLYPDCPGTNAFGVESSAVEVALSDRRCAARVGCAKCFGQFFNGTSLAELAALIERLHGRVNDGPGQRTRSVIAQKINLRYGTTQSKTSRASGAGTPISSSGKTRARGSSATPLLSAAHSEAGSKAAAKRARDQKEAKRRGISVDELRAQRRALHEANRRRKQAGSS